jgi:hypothetical protein
VAYDLHLAGRIRRILRDRHGVSEREMFGGVAFMLDGHMCCGVVKTDLVLRLSPAEVVSALARAHTRPMDFTGKPMKSMLFVDARGVDSDASLSEWVEASCAFVRTLPPGKSRPKSRRAGASR